jgi:hypothetical protein
MAKTNAQLLDEVEGAISRALLGQEVTMNGKRFRQAEIDQLFAIRDRLAAAVAREASGGGLAVNFGMIRRD